MGIIDLQRRQRELGRIRMGDKGTKGQPQKLSTFRLTSPSRRLLERAAELYGGEVREWTGAPTEGQFELYTKSSSLPIIIPPVTDPVSQWYEQWSAGGCTHRCDGRTNTITGKPCTCPAENRGSRNFCAPVTRVNVMLPEIPDVGVWRLETHGFNAARELPGTSEVILMAAQNGIMLRGSLRIEPRKSTQGGQTRRFVVPVIDLDVSMDALLSDGEFSPGGQGAVGPGEVVGGSSEGDLPSPPDELFPEG